MLFLLDSDRLVWHESWIFLILFIVALVFRASSKSDRDQRESRNDRLPELIAFFFTSLALDRLLIVGAVIFRLHRPELMELWIRVVHLGLLVLEVSIYTLVFYLLKDGIKARATATLKGWLEE